MRIKFEDHDKISIVSIEGELSSDHIDGFKRSISERLARGIRDFVIQAEVLNFIDSAGLEALLWMQDSAAEHLGQLRLVNPSPSMQKILEITRLASQIDTHAEVMDAIRSLR